MGARGLRGSRTPDLVTGRVPAVRRVERRPTGPRRACHSRSPSFPGPGVLGVSPQIPGGFPVSGNSPPGPRSGGPHSGTRVRGPPPPCLCRRTPPPPPPRRPIRAPGELRTNLTKLVAGCAGLYLGVGRGPGSPAATAAGCTRLYHCLAALPLRPVPPPTPGPGEEPGPRPVQPRPIRAAPASPPQGLGR